MAEYTVAGVCYNKYETELARKLSDAIDEWGIEKQVEDTWYIADDDNPDPARFKRVQGTVSEWTQERFRDADVIIYICSVVRAVRYIGKLLQDQMTDPAVLAVDAGGRYCIPVLSGRRGEAYELAGVFESKLGIDFVNAVMPEDPAHFDIEKYAAKNGMVVSNSDYAKEIHAALGSGGEVGFYTSYPVLGSIPGGMTWASQGQLGVYISPSFHNAYFNHTLWLIPQCLTIGITCGENVELKQLIRFAKDVMRENGLYEEAVARVAVAGESHIRPEVLKMSLNDNVALNVYSEEQLAGIRNPDGSPMEDCEKAALKGSEGKLLVHAVKSGGMSCAIATKNIYIAFN